MNDDEMKNLIANLFAKANIPEVPPPENDPDLPDPDAVDYVYVAHAFIKEAILLVENHYNYNFPLDYGELFFLLNSVKDSLEISFQDLHKFLPNNLNQNNPPLPPQLPLF